MHKTRDRSRRAGGPDEHDDLRRRLGADAVQRADARARRRSPAPRTDRTAPAAHGGAGAGAQHRWLAPRPDPSLARARGRRRARRPRWPMRVPVVQVVTMGMFVLDHHELMRARATDASPDHADRTTAGRDDEHPSAPHPEVAAVPRQRHEHVHAEQQQRRADHPLHHRVDAARESFGEDDGGDPEREHDRTVPERVAGGEQHGAAGPRLRSGEIGDRGEVVPVDPVPQPEDERGHDHAEAQGPTGHRADLDHPAPLPERRCPPRRRRKPQRVSVDRMTVAADWNMPPIACVSDVVTPSTCAAASPRS